MSKSSTPARAVTYSVVAALAYAALHLTPPLARRPADVLSAGPRAGAPRAAVELTRAAAVAFQRTDSLGRGERLADLLERQGLTGEVATAALGALRDAGRLTDERAPEGLRVVARGVGDSLPSELAFQLAADRVVRLTRSSSGWRGTDEKLAWTTDTVAIAGTIRSSLYVALDEGATVLPRALRLDLAWKLADIFEHRVDMSRDLQPNDGFRVLVQRSTTAAGAVRVDRILAASFNLSGNPVSALRFGGENGAYFDEQGKSLKSGFLRAPLEFRRISSVFGRRRHPILGVWKMHKGTDYAASQGTPVRAIGEGVVAFAGRKHGYGNVIDVRHRNGYVSRYGHLRNFVRGLRVGEHVPQGETIGYVGMTGLATAPHLHFEMLLDGAQHDTRAVLAKLKGGEPIDGGDRAAFERTRSALMSALDRAGARTAAAPAVSPTGSHDGI